MPNCISFSWYIDLGAYSCSPRIQNRSYHHPLYRITPYPRCRSIRYFDLDQGAPVCGLGLARPPAEPHTGWIVPVPTRLGLIG
eukprot:3548883-Prymnesium_polylepis.2